MPRSLHWKSEPVVNPGVLHFQTQAIHVCKILNIYPHLPIPNVSNLSYMDCLGKSANSSFRVDWPNVAVCLPLKV